MSPQPKARALPKPVANVARNVSGSFTDRIPLTSAPSLTCLTGRSEWANVPTTHHCPATPDAKGDTTESKTMTKARNSATPPAMRMDSAGAAGTDTSDQIQDETAYILKTPKNAARLRASIASLEAGRVKTVRVDDLVDLE